MGMQEDVERSGQMVDLAHHKVTGAGPIVIIYLEGLKDIDAIDDFIALITRKLLVPLIPHSPTVNIEEQTPKMLNSSMPNGIEMAKHQNLKLHLNP